MLCVCLQYLVSFLVFFYPGARRPVRAQVSPFHIGLGIGILGLVYLTASKYPSSSYVVLHPNSSFITVTNFSHYRSQ